MSQEKTKLEVIAPTVEEAVQKGLAQLNLPPDAVEIESPGCRFTWIVWSGQPSGTDSPDDQISS